MSQAASQAAAFYREVAEHRMVWGIEDDGGAPAPMTAEGRSMPFWSSEARATKATRSPMYRGFRVFGVAWDAFEREWLPGLERDGILVGVNWSGPRLTGYDLSPADLRRNIETVARLLAGPQ